MLFRSLGDALGAAPNLSKSYLGIAVCIISIAQHAKPNVIQCNDPVLDHVTRLSMDVVIKPLSVKSLASFLNSSGIFFLSIFNTYHCVNPSLKHLSSTHI